MLNIATIGFRSDKHTKRDFNIKPSQFTPEILRAVRQPSPEEANLRSVLAKAMEGRIAANHKGWWCEEVWGSSLTPLFPCFMRISISTSHQWLMFADEQQQIRIGTTRRGTCRKDTQSLCLLCVKQEGRKSNPVRASKATRRTQPHAPQPPPSLSYIVDVERF